MLPMCQYLNSTPKRFYLCNYVPDELQCVHTVIYQNFQLFQISEITLKVVFLTLNVIFPKLLWSPNEMI